MSLTALIVARTGCSWREVWEEFDMQRIEALLKHWQREPPVDATFAAFVDYHTPSEPSENDVPTLSKLSPEDRAAYARKAIEDYERAFPKRAP